jgi:hypothetical protein
MLSTQIMVEILNLVLIVSNIINLMSSHVKFEVKFVRRQMNLVTRTLARAAFHY